MRPAIKNIKRSLGGRRMVGAEIGVFEGTNAKDMLDGLPSLEKLYLVDPYEQYGGWATDGWYGKVFKAKTTAYKTLNPYGDRVQWVTKKTEDAVNDIPPNTLDFVYIDGNHTYEYVKKDLEAATVWVKRGGVISGHDFAPGKRGVVRAVLEFCKDRNITFMVRRRDWWFEKK